MVRVKGGQEVHFRGSQAGDAPLAAQQACEDAGETGHGPHVPLPRRMKVDALAASLLLRGRVLCPQGIEIMGRDGPGGRRRRRLGMASLLALVAFAASQVLAGEGVEQDFLQGREGIVLDDDPIATEFPIDREEQVVQTHVGEVFVHRARLPLVEEAEHGAQIDLPHQTRLLVVARGASVRFGCEPPGGRPFGARPPRHG